MAQAEHGSYSRPFFVFLGSTFLLALLEAVLSSDAVGYRAHLALLPADEEAVKQALEASGEVREDDYYRLAVRYEVVEQVVMVLTGGTLQAGERKAQYGPEVYAAATEDGTEPSGTLH